MTGFVFLAVILAACLHAVWNAWVKKGTDMHVGMAGIVIGQVPLAVVCLAFVPAPAVESWGLLVAGVILHVGYHFFLLNAYRVGDLTQVYPLARGSAPLIVAAVSVLFMGETLATTELLGVVAIAIGILSLVLVRQNDGQRNLKAAAFALVTGCFIAAYSLVDGSGARLAGTALGFFGWLAIGSALLFSAITAVTSPTVLRQVARAPALPMLLGGSASFVAFAIVIWAFTQAPIALVSALRETSIVFALLIGVLVLREKLNLIKLFSTFVTLAGAALLRVAR